ncbi:MAG: sulfatase [Gemmatimonadota bacterium]
MTASSGEGATRGEGASATSAVPLVALAVWFALVTALAEDAAILLHREVLGQITRVSPHVWWMTAAANLVFFVAAAGALVLAGRAWVRVRALPVRAFAFGALGVLALVLLVRGLHWAADVLVALGAGRLVYEAARRWPVGLARLVRRSTLPLSLGFVVLGVAIDARARRAEVRAIAALPPSSAGFPNVVLLILDTVRARSLALYGYERSTSPRLDALAERSLVFDRAISTSPWTLPSHGSMFTGRWPHELRTGFFTPLDDRWPTLAEVLGTHGYATAGFSANLIYATRDFGLDRGFQHFEDYEIEPGQALVSSSLGRALATSTFLRNLVGHHELANRKSAGEVADDFLEWWEEERPPDRPSFAFLNFFDAHSPYLPPAPFDRRFGAASLDRRLWHFGNLREGVEARRSDEWMRDPTDAWKDQNDGAIAYVDHVVGRLVDRLEARGELDETILIVASDHGEQHGEHGLFYHWNSLYMPLLHVPLLIRYDDAVPAVRVPALVSLRDLPATVLDLVGIADHPFPGRSLRSRWRDAAAPQDITDGSNRAEDLESGGVAPLSELETGPLFSIVDGRYHYIVQPSAGHEEFYDLVADPLELRDLADSTAYAEQISAARREMIRLLEAEP